MSDSGDIESARTPGSRPKVIKRSGAFVIHIFTALGAGFALMALLEAVHEHWAGMFGWLGVALVVDALDGPMARRFNVAAAGAHASRGATHRATGSRNHRAAALREGCRRVGLHEPIWMGMDAGWEPAHWVEDPYGRWRLIPGRWVPAQ